MSWKELKRSVKYPLLIALIRVLQVIIKILPWGMTTALFTFLARIAFYLIGKEREKTIHNLTIAYGKEKSPEEIRAMAKEVFKNLGRSAAELAIKLDVKSNEKYFSNVIIDGMDNLKSAYSKGEGVVMLVAHIGCWETIPQTLPRLGFNSAAIGKPLKNDRLNTLLMSSREQLGVKMIERGTSYRTILKVLKEHNFVGILIDQDTSVKSTFVKFYGKPAYTPIGAAMMALDSNAPVVAVANLRTPEGKYRFYCSPEIDIVRTDDRKSDIQTNTENFHSVIEDIIMKNPTQWVWMHERWKTTPEMVEERERKKEEERLQRKKERLEGNRSREV